MKFIQKLWYLRRLILVLFVAGILISLPAFTTKKVAVQNTVFPTCIEVSSEGTDLYIGDKISRQILVMGLTNERIINLIGLPIEPSCIRNINERQLAVSGGGAEGKLVIVDKKTGKIASVISVGNTPSDIAIDKETNRIYVSNQFSSDISVIDLAVNKEIKRIAVLREPMSMALVSKMNCLLVTNQLPIDASIAKIVSAEVSVIDIVGNKLECNIKLPDGTTGVKGICASLEGNFAYVTHTLARYLMPTNRIDHGWMNTNVLSIIDVKTRKVLNTVLLDESTHGAANPWGITLAESGEKLCICHAGSHEVSIIDRIALQEKLKKYEAINTEPVINDFSFLSGLRRRIRLDGNGPRHLIAIKGNLYVAEYFSGTIGKVDLNNYSKKEIVLGSNHLTKEQEGEMQFNNADLCYEQWQTCISCHPDGRADGLNWDLLNDGVGSPKNAKSLLLSHKTPPAMSTGIRANAEAAVRSGISYILFTKQDESIAKDMDIYLKGMKPVLSPHLLNGQLNESAKRGEKLFFSSKVGCAVCHPKPLYTDMKLHDAGTHAELDFTTDNKGKYMPQEKFDTPTLIEVWRTAPYLHDGRYATVKEVITRGNSNNKRGATSVLSEAEINDLVEYVLSL